MTDEAAREQASSPAPPDHGGVLVVDKPAGVTSHDVVDVVRRRFRTQAVGHLGTLDPGASGLLALALGTATRCVPVWQGGEKTYEATLRLGVVTSTQDLAGEVLERHPVEVTEAQVRAASAGLVGEIDQVPPMVSALHVRGERLYRLARRGITVERAARRVRVAAWDWLGFELPLARFRVRCSGGTYVRTLAHDLGARLGTGGALEKLRRLRSEPFDLSRAVTVQELIELGADAAWACAGVPLEDALATLPTVRLDSDGARAIGFGASVAVDAARTVGLPEGAGPRSILIADEAGGCLALGEFVRDPDRGGVASPHVVFPWAVREGRPRVA